MILHGKKRRSNRAPDPEHGSTLAAARSFGRCRRANERRSGQLGEWEVWRPRRFAKAEQALARTYWCQNAARGLVTFRARLLDRRWEERPMPAFVLRESGK